MSEGVEIEKPKSGSNPQLICHLEKAAVQWSDYVSFNTSNAVTNEITIYSIFRFTKSITLLLWKCIVSVRP